MRREESRKLSQHLCLLDADMNKLKTHKPLWSQLTPYIGKVLLLHETGARTYKDKDYTVLSYREEESGVNVCKITPAFDSKNIFISGGYPPAINQPISLRGIAKNHSIEEMVGELAYFRVESIVPTKEYPLTASKAYERLFPDKHPSDLSHEEWTALRKYYDSSAEMKTAGNNYTSFHEIHKIYISKVD